MWNHNAIPALTPLRASHRRQPTSDICFFSYQISNIDLRSKQGVEERLARSRGLFRLFGILGFQALLLQCTFQMENGKITIFSGGPQK
jgi:hypothetical protein